MIRAAVYLRISQDRSGEGAGVERQLEDCLALCAQLGWQVKEVYEDNDISAFSAKVRPAFDRMVAAVRGGDCDAIVAYRSDRLFRRIAQLEGVVTLVEQTGVQIKTVASGGIDLTTAEGRMGARILASASQGESERMAERIRREKASKAERGEPNGGPRPFGYNADLRTVNEGEAAVIKEAADRVISGESLTSVTRDFVRRGLTTSRGNQWRHKSLLNILTGARWAGLREHRGQLREAVWPAVLTREQHDLLRVKLAPQRRTRPVRRHLLTGLVWCTQCGGRMEGHLRSGQPEYRCPGEFGLGTGCRRRIRGDVEDDVVARVLVLLANDLEFFLPRRERPFVDLAAMNKRLEELAEDYVVGKITKGAFEAATSVVRRTMEAAEAARAAQAQESPLVALQRGHDDLKATWDALAITQRRAILAAVVDRIEVGPGRVGMNTYDPARVTVRTKSVRVSDEEPQPEPDAEHLQWDWERDQLAHEGVFLSRGLSATTLTAGQQGFEARTTRVRVEPSGRSGDSPKPLKLNKPLRRGPEEARKAAEAVE